MKIKALVLALIAVVFASGCSLIKSEPAPGNEILQQGLTKLYYEADSAKIDVSAKGDMKAPEGQTPAEIKFDVKLSGDLDNTKPAEPKFNLLIAGTGSWDKVAEQKVNAEMRSDSKTLFFIVNDVSDFDGQIPAEMIAQLKSIWFKMPIPEGTFASLDKKSEMTEGEKKIKELAEKTNFIKDIKYEGTKKIMGTESYVFNGTLDKEALKTFTIETAKLDDATPDLTETEIADMDAQLKMFDMTGKFYIGVEDKMLRGAEGTITATPDGGSVKITFKLEIGAINEAITVEEPAGAQDFDPMMLLGGGAAVPADDMSGYGDLETMGQ